MALVLEGLALRRGECCEGNSLQFLFYRREYPGINLCFWGGRLFGEYNSQMIDKDRIKNGFEYTS